MGILMVINTLKLAALNFGLLESLHKAEENQDKEARYKKVKEFFIIATIGFYVCFIISCFALDHGLPIM